MASPWKFLARLVSPQRLLKHGTSEVNDVKPDGLPASSAIDQSLEIGGPPLTDVHLPVGRPAAAPVELLRTDESSSHAAENGDGDPSKLEPKSDLAMPAVAAPPGDSASAPEIIAASVPTTRRLRARRVDVVVATSQTSPATPSAIDEIANADDEIRQLRIRLAHKLRLQNALLKKMLERFDR